MISLLFALALSGQCPGGVCRVPSRPAYASVRPAGSWVVANDNPAQEVYGAVDASGVFRYTARRNRFAPQFYQAFAPSCPGGKCPRR